MSELTAADVANNPYLGKTRRGPGHEPRPVKGEGLARF